MDGNGPMFWTKGVWEYEYYEFIGENSWLIQNRFSKEPQNYHIYFIAFNVWKFDAYIENYLS